MISDEKFIEAYLTSNTQKEAAKKLDITPVAFSRRLKTDKIQEKLNKLKEDTNSKLTCNLATEIQNSINKLTAIRDTSTNEFAVINSATAIIRFFKDFYLLQSIQERLTALEEFNAVYK